MTLKNRATEQPQHRADLAGSLAARTPLRRYIEVIFGSLLGLLMWVVDAAMHVRLGRAASSSGGFLDELFRPGITPTVFRGAYLIVAITLGWVFWRARLKREAEERQEHERALAGERLRTMLAIINTFRLEVSNPLAIIEANAEMLAQKLMFSNDKDALNEIADLASRVSSLVKRLANSAPMYVVDRSGFERIVPHENFEDGNGGAGP